jgi:hypothetical protein
MPTVDLELMGNKGLACSLERRKWSIFSCSISRESGDVGEFGLAPLGWDIPFRQLHHAHEERVELHHGEGPGHINGGAPAVALRVPAFERPRARGPVLGFRRRGRLDARELVALVL